MFNSIWEDVKQQFRFGNMVTRLIVINAFVFVAVNIVNLGFTVFQGFKQDTGFYDFVKFFSLSNDLFFDLTHPWVIITNMFLHVGFWHFLWNMLFLYWFGRIVGDLVGNHRILPLYLLGGLAGGSIYLLTANFIYSGESFAYGASAAVMAIVMASGTIAPDYNMRLILIGDVKLKYIVGVLIFLDLIGIANLSNTGGHLAHLGGALFGFIFIRQLQSGQDWSEPVNNLVNRLEEFFTRLFSSNPKGPKVVYRSKDAKRKKHTPRAKGRAKSDTSAEATQARIDEILEKIKKSGYESLTDEEKEFLFNASKEKD